MLGISTINTFGFRNSVKRNFNQKRKVTGANCSVLSMRQCTGTRAKKNSTRKNPQQVELKLELKSAWFILAGIVAFAGAFYLYQVNSLAAKGYELTDLQNKVGVLQEANKKNRIQEVELMSMYNIEKATQNSNLVSLSDASYLELNGPVAMK